MAENLEMDFNNFDEFYAFIKQEGKNIQTWPQEKVAAFANRVSDLCASNPEFKQRYDSWVARVEEKRQKYENTIDLNNPQKARKQLMLKEAKLKIKKVQAKLDEKHKAEEDIVVLNKDASPKPRYVIGRKPKNTPIVNRKNCREI